MVLAQDHYLVLRDICIARKSVRAFSPKPITDDQIKKILDIAYTSPYVSGRKNWGIEVVKDQELIARMAAVVKRQVAQVSHAMRKDFQKTFLAYSRNFTAFESAPVVFVPNFRVSPHLTALVTSHDSGIERLERDNFIKSISAVCTLILLAATSIGLGSCYMTGPLIAENELATLLNLKRERRIGALIPVGYEATDNKYSGCSKDEREERVVQS